MAPIDWRSTNRASVIVSLTIVVGFATAAFVFCLWVIHREIVQIVFPGISPVTAFGFMLLLAAIALLRHSRTHSAARGILVVVISIGLLSLAERLLGFDLHVGQLFGIQSLADVPALFAPNTAITLTLISLSLLLPDTRIVNRDQWSQLLLIIAVIITGIAFLGHLYNVSQFY